MNGRLFQKIILVVVLLFALDSPLFAQPAAQPDAAAEIRSCSSAVVLADSWSVGKIVYHGGRTRIVQVCAVVMSLALYIMMRKLN